MTFIEKIRSIRNEDGSLAAVLAVAVIIATITLTLGAYSISQIGIAKTAEAQNSMNASILDVTNQLTRQVVATGFVDAVPNKQYSNPNVDTVITVKDISPLPATSLGRGYQVILEASWRNGERTLIETKLIPIPNINNIGSGVIAAINPDGSVTWG